jgi:hypothetical protein
MARVASQQSWMRADPGSRIEIRVLRQPSPSDRGAIKLDLDLSAGFTGQVALEGTAGESAVGWKIGYIQLKHTTTEWADYRGPTRADGSIFAAMDRPPARTQQLCLDCGPNQRPFYDVELPVNSPATISTDRTYVLGAGMVIPPSGRLEVIVSHSDAPAREFEIALPNTRFTPPRDNYIRSLESRAAFITLLTAQDPQGHYHFVKHMYWNVIWRAHFRWNAGARALEKTDQSGGVNYQRQAHSGIPNDARFAASLRGNVPAASLQLCNPLANAAFSHPGRLTYSNRYEMWRVAR